MCTLDASTFQKKAEIFLEKDVYPLLKNFPQAEKYSLSQEIKQSCYKLIRAAVMANNVPKKRLEWLQDAQSVLVLKMYTLYTAEAWKKCLPVRKKYITQKKLLEMQGKLNELGRIIGGLQKSVFRPPSSPKK